MTLICDIFFVSAKWLTQIATENILFVCVNISLITQTNIFGYKEIVIWNKIKFSFIVKTIFNNEYNEGSIRVNKSTKNCWMNESTINNSVYERYTSNYNYITNLF